MLSVEFGPTVYCDYADQEAYTHRPAGSNDRWFCSMCGATGHILWTPFFEGKTP